MTNILFVTSSLAHDGTQTFIMNVYRNLDPGLYHADFLLTNGKETDYSREVTEKGSTIYVTPTRKSNVFLFLTSLNLFFRNHYKQYHSIHFNYGSLTSIAAVGLAAFYGIPVRIMHSHNSSVIGVHNKLLHFLNRPFASKMVNVKLACSKKAGRFFFGNSSFNVVFNGIDVGKYSYDKERRRKTRQALGLTENCMVIGHVGRFVEVKNHSFVLEIFHEYLKLNANAKLLLVGVGELQDKIKQKAQELHIMNHILFLGLRLDVPDIMQAMDCFLMPSLFEGLPFVLVEAQTAGMQCFISDTIDKGTDITGNVKFLSLQNSADVWAKTIFDVMPQFVRVKVDNKIKDSGYDISETTKWLEQQYSSKQ